MVKAYSQPLIDNLRSRVVRWCICWKITRRDGLVFAYTEHDKDLVVGSTTFKTTNSFTSSAIESKLDFSVDNLNVQAIITDDEMTENDLKAGRFDGARVEVFGCDWANPSGTILKLRAGRLGEVKTARTVFEGEIRGLMQVIQQPIGRVYTLECNADLGDSRCKVDMTPFTVTGTLDGGGGLTVSDSSRNEAEDYFKYGTIEFTSGENNGFRVEIKKYKDGVFTLWEPVGYAVELGTTYIAKAGCDKLRRTCIDKFNNILNNRSTPFQPTQDDAFNYPDAKTE